MKHDIYVRAHTVQVEKKKSDTSRQNTDPKWPRYILIFDCESRTTADQTLTFGFWRFAELRNGQYVCLEEGVFHDDRELTRKEAYLLCKYASTLGPDTVQDGSDRFLLLPRSRFVKEKLGPAIHAGALLVCFNAGFDWSRLAVDWEIAENGGWSLILSQYQDPETGELTA